MAGGPGATFRFDGDTSGLNASLNRSKRKSDDVGRSFGKGAAALGRMAAAGTAVATAAQLATAAWSETVQTIEEATQRANAAESSRARLASLAETPQELQQLFQSADDLRKKFGLTPDDANQIQFAVGSNKISPEASEEFAKFATLGNQTSVNQIIDASSNFASNFEGINATQAARAGFVGALSSQVLPDEFLGAVSRAAPVAESTGTSPEQLIALFSQVRGDKIKELSTGVRAFAREFIGDERDIATIADDLATSGRSDLQIQKQLGAEEAFLGFKQIRNATSAARDALPSIQESLNTDVLGQAVDVNLSDPQLRASFEKRQAEASADLAEEEAFAFGGTRAEIALARQREKAVGSISPLGFAGRRLGAGAGEAGTANELVTTAAGEVGSAIGTGIDAALFVNPLTATPRIWIELLRRIAGNTEPRQDFNENAQEE